MPGDGVGWEVGRTGHHAGLVTTRIGLAIMAVGVVLILLRWSGVIDVESADIASVMAVVLGALAVAIDGEAADA